MRGMLSARLIWFCRLCFAVSIFAILFSLVGAEQILALFAQLNWAYFVALLFLSVVMIGISCIKWRLFLRAYGRDASLGHLMYLYTVSYFINSFIPSYVGGDLHRSYHLGDVVGCRKRALAATILERFTGFLAMGILGLAIVCSGAVAASGLEYPIALIGILALILMVAVFSQTVGDLLTRKSLMWVEKFDQRAALRVITKIALKIETALSACRGDWRLFVKAMFLSFVYHGLTCLNTYLGARAVGWDGVDFVTLFIVVPLVLIVGTVPLTPSGVGLQEGAFMYFLQMVGATPVQALGTGLVLRIKVLLIAVIGAVLWVRLKHHLSQVKDSLSTASNERGKSDDISLEEAEQVNIG